MLSSGDYDNEYCGSVTIPSTVTYNGTTYSVTSIGNNAFAWCSRLTSVTVPSHTEIKQSSFPDYTKIIERLVSYRNIKKPMSVTKLGTILSTAGYKAVRKRIANIQLADGLYINEIQMKYTL